MNTFNLKIIACDRIFYDGECESFVFPGYDGEMAILANHEPMSTTIDIGKVRFRKPGETDWEYAVVSDGLIKVEHNHVNVLVYSAERPDEIDAFREKEAKEREEEELKQKQSLIEYNQSQSAMARAMARLRGVDKFDI